MKITTPQQFELAVRRAKPGEKISDISFGDMLGRVAPSGTKSWILRLKKDGKEARVVLGRYDPKKPSIHMSLKDANAKAEEVRVAMRKTGLSPAEKKRTEKEASKQAEAAKAALDSSTFEAVARRWHGQLSTAMNAKYRAQILSALQRWAFPAIGTWKLDAITPGELLDRALCPMLEYHNPKGKLDPRIDTAMKLLQNVNLIYDFARMRNLCVSNPAAMVKIDFAKRTKKARKVKPRDHFPSVVDGNQGDQDKLRRVLQAIADYPSERTRLALQAILFTAARSGELRGATWHELDLEARLWTIPGARMKAGKEHVVLLSDQAVACFEALRELAGDADLVLPSDSDPKKPISDMALSMALRRMGFDGKQTVHGFRAIFSTMMREDGRFGRDAIEASLAHTVAGNQVEAAYMRGKFMAERKELMQAYADLLDRIREGKPATVVNLKRGAK